MRAFTAAPLFAATLVAVGACSSADVQQSRMPTNDAQEERIREQYGTIQGTDGFTILGGDDRERERGGGGGIGVNAFLWRASLDTIDFMPLASADPFGGVIITEWYRPPDTPEERFKLTVYILDTALRADALKISVFRQVRGEDGEWLDGAVDENMATELENTVLTRARQLRIAGAGG